MPYFWLKIFACLTLLAVAPGGARAQEAVPDEGAVRNLVQAGIENTPGHRATLGTLQAAMELSISFGAPAWNAGDHAACSRFYVKTGRELCAAFAAADGATPSARAVLDDLKTALGRVDQSNDIEANAWTMRFVFDKEAVASAVEADRTVRLLELGHQAFTRSQFDDAQNAYAEATAALREMDGVPMEEIPGACRVAPLALSEAQLGQKHYAEAAAEVEEGLHFMPNLPATDMDVRGHFQDRTLYDLLIGDLRDEAALHPQDAELEFLLGYHLYFSGQRDAAKECFEKTLKLNANHAGAKKFLDACENPPKPVPGEAPGKGDT